MLAFNHDCRCGNSAVISPQSLASLAGMRRAFLTGLLALAATPAVARPAIPTSARSRAAQARVGPRLRRELGAMGLTLGAPVFVRITKEPAVLSVFLGGADGLFRLFRAYRVCAASGTLGPKLREGDGQAPEGFYQVAAPQLNPASSFHLSFDLGFPNAYDRAHGRTGSFLMVHGACVSIGCFAMTDPAIEEIWTLIAAALAAGQRTVPVHVFPFPMTPEALAARAASPHAAFWAELAPAWRLFETHERPPRVSVRGGRYVIAPG